MNVAKDTILRFHCVWGLLATRMLLMMYASASFHIDSAKSLRWRRISSRQDESFGSKPSACICYLGEDILGAEAFSKAL
jgi:hypothetical protein